MRGWPGGATTTCRPTPPLAPRTELILVDSTDSAGPILYKVIAEMYINPVVPALANAVHDATGVRYRELPLTPDRIFAPCSHTG